MGRITQISYRGAFQGDREGRLGEDSEALGISPKNT